MKIKGKREREEKLEVKPTIINTKKHRREKGFLIIRNYSSKPI